MKIGHRLLWDHFLHMQSDRNGSVLLLLMHKVEKKYINIHINSYIALVWWFSSTMKHHHPIWHKNRCAVIHFFYLYREYDNVASIVKLLPTWNNLDWSIQFINELFNIIFVQYKNKLDTSQTYLQSQHIHVMKIFCLIFDVNNMIKQTDRTVIPFFILQSSKKCIISHKNRKHNILDLHQSTCTHFGNCSLQA